METLNSKLETLNCRDGLTPTETQTISPISSDSTSLYPSESLWLSTIPESFRSISLEGCDRLPVGLVEFGYQWAKSWPLKSLYLYGEYGSGKTSLAMAVIRQAMREWCKKRYFWPRYLTGRQLDSRLLQAYKSDYGDDYELSSLSEIDVLCLDDVDKISATDRFKTQFFELINRRQINCLPTIITSNDEPKELSHHFDGSVISRMGDAGQWHILQFPKRDLRQSKILKF